VFILLPSSLLYLLLTLHLPLPYPLLFFREMEQAESGWIRSVPSGLHKKLRDSILVRRRTHHIPVSHDSLIGSLWVVDKELFFTCFVWAWCWDA